VTNTYRLVSITAFNLIKAISASARYCDVECVGFRLSGDVGPHCSIFKVLLNYAPNGSVKRSQICKRSEVIGERK